MPAALLGIDWESVKLDFIRLRTEGVKYEDTINELCDRHETKPGTVEYHMRKGGWVQILQAARGFVSTKLKQKLELTAEAIANEVGETFLEGVKELRGLKATKVQEALLKSQTLKTYSEVRSRYNPDGQEKAQGATLFQVNVNSAPVETKPVIEMNSTETPETTP